MYCPVDGTEWQEGIARCPEHHVDLVDELPEEFEGLYDEDDVPLVVQLGLEPPLGWVVIVVAVAAVAYAVAGILAAGVYALAALRDWAGIGFIFVLRFFEDAARVVALGGLGCLAAGVLGRAWVRLGHPVDDATVARAHGEGGGAREQAGLGAWLVPILTSLVIVFTLVWVVTGVATSWDQVQLRKQAMTPSDPSLDPSDTFIALAAVNNAAYTCTLGALVTMGALLMARAWDRVKPRP